MGVNLTYGLTRGQGKQDIIVTAPLSYSTATFAASEKVKFNINIEAVAKQIIRNFSR